MVFGVNYGIKSNDKIDIRLTSAIWNTKNPNAKLVETFFHEIQHSIDTKFEHNNVPTSEKSFITAYRNNILSYYQTK